MADVAYIELPSLKTRAHVCVNLLVTTDQEAVSYSIVIQQHLMHLCVQLKRSFVRL